MAADGKAGLRIEIEPLASAFFAGELFEARITLRNTNPGAQHGLQYERSSIDQGHGRPTSPQTAGPLLQSGLLPHGRDRRRSHAPRERLHQIGPKIEARREALEHDGDLPGPQSPQTAVTPGGKRDWRRQDGRGKMGDMGLGDGTLSTQELLRGLTAGRGEHMPSRVIWTRLTPLRLASDHMQSNVSLPPRHPHARQISLASMPPSPQTDRFPSHSAEMSPRPSLSTIRETEDPRNIDLSGNGSASSPRPRRARPTQHLRQPSYLNAYGADALGIGRGGQHGVPLPVEPGTINILWAHARFRGQFTPSATHIPPDPLLPLRSLLLHQPLGSGSLTPADKPGTSSRWSLSFGSGTIGHEQNPSLTGSLVGLARGLVWSGQGGTLDEERRKVWETKALPVLESVRSLVGIDIVLKPGELQSCERTARRAGCPMRLTTRHSHLPDDLACQPPA